MYGEDMYDLYDNVRWQVVTFPAPAAGGELDLKPTGLGAWRLWFLSFLFTASAVVANRTPNFFVAQGALNYLFLPNTTVIAAAGSQRFQGAPNVLPAAAIGAISYLPWPGYGVILKQGDHFVSTTTNLDPGDQYSQIVALIEEIPLKDSARALAELAAERDQYGI